MPLDAQTSCLTGFFYKPVKESFYTILIRQNNQYFSPFWEKELDTGTGIILRKKIVVTT